MCFDVSIPIRLIWSTDGPLCLRSATTSFWHARCRRGPSTPTGDIAVGMFRPLVRPGIAGIGEDSLLPAMQQGRRLVDVGFVGGGTGDRVHHPRGDIHPDMRLHPEVPLVALLGLVHLRVAGLAPVLGRGW